MCCGIPGVVQGDRRPHGVDLAFGDALPTQEVARGVRAVDLETLALATVPRSEPCVVEHGAGIEQFGIELQAATLTRQGPEVVDAAGVMEE
jgi:hypothetical protein